MYQELNTVELDQEYGELLPARETLSAISINATNSSMAFNAASFDATAHSAAFQSIVVEVD